MYSWVSRGLEHKSQNDKSILQNSKNVDGIGQK